MTTLATVFLGLGSNLGDREANIREALERLARRPDVRMTRVSSCYETAAVGNTEQPDFINAVAQVETDLGPLDLLKVALGVERDMGRTRNFRWAPRVIDIDVLLYDCMAIDTPELSIPHPRMMERAFVIAPLAEIAPALELPDGRSTRQLLEELKNQEVRRLAEVA